MLDQLRAAGFSLAALRNQSRDIWPVMLAGALFVLVVTSATVLIILQKDVSARMLMSDPAAFMDQPWWLGAFSNVGVLVLAASSGVWGVGAYLLYRAGTRPPGRRFALVSAFLSVALTLDNTYMLHEQVFPHRGIPELAIYALYAIAAIAYVAIFFRSWLQTEYLLLFASFVLFMLSVLLDSVPQITSSSVEDVCGVAGMVFWLLYGVRASTFFVRRALSRETPDA